MQVQGSQANVAAQIGNDYGMDSNDLGLFAWNFATVNDLGVDRRIVTVFKDGSALIVLDGNAP
jgi:hypothetical protein